MRIAGIMMAMMSVAACQDEALELPSGMMAELVETLVEPQPDGESWMILRVVAPELAGRQVGAETMAADTDLLCRTWGLEAAAEAEALPDQIVVQMMSERVERGQPARGVTQVFAGYRLRDGACIWEDF